MVIEGLIHNDDPNAAELWMPTGSYWTQPAGEVHITAAKGQGRLAYIEIQSGPYLVLPEEDATDNGERPVNLHASNLVWQDASTAAAIDTALDALHDEDPRIAYLWGDPQDENPSGSLVELPAGFNGALKSDGASLRVVLIEGRATLNQTKEQRDVALEPGSYAGSHGPETHRISLATDGACVVYVRTEGSLEITAE